MKEIYFQVEYYNFHHFVWSLFYKWSALSQTIGIEQFHLRITSRRRALYKSCLLYTSDAADE